MPQTMVNSTQDTTLCHIRPTNNMGAAVIRAEYAWYTVVPFGEIEASPSDSKHVG